MDYEVGFADYETNLFDYFREEYKLNAQFVNIKLNGTHYTFFNSQDFISFLDEHSSYRKKLIVYFHNLKFDSLFFMQELMQKFRFVFPVYSGSKLLKIRIGNFIKKKKNKKGKITKSFQWKIEFRDSASLIPSSLRKIGQGLGLLKGNTEESARSLEDFVEYCKRDCDILELAIQKLCEVVSDKTDVDLSISNLPLTSPALAKRVFNTMIGKEIAKRLYNDRFDALLRPYYFGGRTEVFDLNFHENVYYNDFNSAYPYVMHHYEYPLPPYHQFKAKNWKFWLNKYEFIGGLFEIDESGLYIPMFSERLDNGKVVYFQSRKIVFLFKEELKRFVELYGSNRVIEMKWGFMTRNWLPLFREYVEIFYKLKSEAPSDSYERILYKLFLNSLYGKFGESKEKEIYKIYKNAQAFLEENGKEALVNMIDFDYGVVLRKKSNQRVMNNVLIAMRITALTRLHLYDYMVKVGFENVIYCDTDSIVSTKLIENSKELGKMSPEFKALKFRALAPKEYWILTDTNEMKTKMKGYGLRDKLTYEQFIDIYKYGKSIHQVLSFKQCIIRDKEFGTCVNAIKEKKTLYDKREVLPDLTTRAIKKEDFYKIKLQNEQIIKTQILNV